MNLNYKLPERWKWSTLAEIANTQKNAIADGPFGSNLKLSDYVESGVPVLQGKNITNNIFTWGDVRFITQEKAEELKRSQVQIGDLLMIKIGSIGYSALIDNLHGFEKAVIPANMAKISFDHSKVDGKYLWYWLTSIDSVRELKARSSKTAQPAISLAKIKPFPIPLPPLETQKQIAAILEKADQLRKNCQQMEQELSSLAQSVFIDMFGDPVSNPKEWKIGKIKDLLISANYGTSEKSSTDIMQYPVLRMNNITYEGNWDFSSLKYMEMDESDEDKYLVKAGDLLFNRTNSRELVGKTAVYREEKPMAYAGYLVRARCNSKGHPEYISAFLNSDYGKQTLQSMCKSIVGMANINAKEFQSIKIPIPPVKKQEEFAHRVESILKSVKLSHAEYAQYDVLFNALMQKAFKGELNLDQAAF